MSKKGFIIISSLVAIGGIAYMKFIRKPEDTEKNKKCKDNYDAFQPLYSLENDPNLKEVKRSVNEEFDVDDEYRNTSANNNELSYTDNSIITDRRTPQKKEGFLKKCKNFGANILAKISCPEDNESVLDETGNQDQFQEEVIPETESKPEITCIDELLKDGNNLGGFINKTDSILSGKSPKSEKINCIALYKNWRTILDMGGCKKLIAEYDNLAKKSGIISEDISEDTAENFLKLWMEFLKELGVYKYSDKNLNEDGNIIVNTDNRAFYENGRKFPDGTICKIVETPWIFNDKVYFRGTLEPTEIPPAPQPQLSDETQNQSIEQTETEEEQLS